MKKQAETRVRHKINDLRMRVRRKTRCCHVIRMFFYLARLVFIRLAE